MGSPFKIVFYHTDSIDAEKTALESFLLVDSINDILSDYQGDSEINRITKNSYRQKISPLLYDILLEAKQAWETSQHTFDVTSGSLTHLWRKTRKENKIPQPNDITLAQKNAGWDLIKIFSDTSIQFSKLNTQLDFGGIAKGYAADRVADLLKKKNIDQFLIDAGGDLVLGAKPPESDGWRIGVSLPQTEEVGDSILVLSNCSVATSGSFYQFTKSGEKIYSHIIDPRTGYGTTELKNVTIIAKNGALADWLATACSILSLEDSKKLVTKYDATLIVGVKEKDKIQYYYSYKN